MAANHMDANGTDDSTERDVEANQDGEWDGDLIVRCLAWTKSVEHGSAADQRAGHGNGDGAGDGDAAAGDGTTGATGARSEDALRVIAVIATQAVREAARRHGAAGAPAVALGRAQIAGLLLATLTKGEERVTLQILGDGPFGTITADATAAGTVRAFMKHPDAATAQAVAAGGVDADRRVAPARMTVAPGVGRNGIVSVIRDLGLRENFSGRTTLADGEIDTDVERYLTDSEQIASVLACEVLLDEKGGVGMAAGILVQALPQTEAVGVIDELRPKLRAGALAELLAASNTVDQNARAPEQLARDLFHQVLAAGTATHAISALDVLDGRPIRFECPCSRDRAAGALALLGDAELSSLIREDGQAEVTCNFCRATYDFSDVDLEKIRREARTQAVPPS